MVYYRWSLTTTYTRLSHNMRTSLIKSLSSLYCTKGFSAWQRTKKLMKKCAKVCTI